MSRIKFGIPNLFSLAEKKTRLWRALAGVGWSPHALAVTDRSVDPCVFEVVAQRHNDPDDYPQSKRDDAQKQVEQVTGFFLPTQHDRHLLIRVGDQ